MQTPFMVSPLVTIRHPGHLAEPVAGVASRMPFTVSPLNGTGILDMSQNKLQELHADAFHGLTFSCER